MHLKMNEVQLHLCHTSRHMIHKCYPDSGSHKGNLSYTEQQIPHSHLCNRKEIGLLLVTKTQKVTLNHIEALTQDLDNIWISSE